MYIVAEIYLYYCEEIKSEAYPNADYSLHRSARDNFCTPNGENCQGKC